MIKTPLHRVTVAPFDFDEWDESRKKMKELGLALPEKEENVRTKASIDMGTVVQVGPTAFKDFGTDSPVQEGTVIAFVKNAGKFVKDPYTNQEYLVINDEDVVMIFEKETND